MPLPLRTAVVLRPAAETCEVAGAVVRWAAPFAPRADRVTPGDLVALAPARDGEVVVWRWYDAVVLSEHAGQVRLWEPAHGEVLAQRRHARGELLPGSRAYLSSGLPGADWWVAGPDAWDVELDEVAAFYEANGLWDLL
jgi:hypothetical protein